MLQTAQYTHIGGRTCNEDSVHQCACGGSLCVVVADGLGGHGGGDVASELVCRTVCDQFDGTVSASGLAALIQAAH